MDSVYDIEEAAEKSMSQLILVVEANKDESQALCALLGRQHFRTIALDSLGSVKERKTPEMSVPCGNSGSGLSAGRQSIYQGPQKAKFWLTK